MKKTQFLTILILSLALTGCGKETLNCSKTEENDSGIAKANHVITFNNGKITNYKIQMGIELEDKYQDYADTFLKDLEKAFDDYKDMEGVTYNLNNDNNTVSITLEGNYQKMDDDSKKAFGIDGSVTAKDAKKKLEDEDYVCK